MPLFFVKCDKIIISQFLNYFRHKVSRTPGQSCLQTNVEIEGEGKIKIVEIVRAAHGKILLEQKADELTVDITTALSLNRSLPFF